MIIQPFKIIYVFGEVEYIKSSSAGSKIAILIRAYTKDSVRFIFKKG